MFRKSFWLLGFAVPLVDSHAVLVTPIARDGMGTVGNVQNKLKGSKDVWLPDSTQINTCGGAANNDQGPGLVQVQYETNGYVRVQWNAYIPHPSEPGVKLAVHYSNGDTFTNNVLAKNILFDNEMNSYYTVVRLPDKQCDKCVLQWTWSSKSDSGFYMGCSDIQIKRSNILPTCSHDLGLNPSSNAMDLSHAEHCLPTRHLCAAQGGQNESPQISWSSKGSMAMAQSYVYLMERLSMPGSINGSLATAHLITDIPMGTMMITRDGDGGGNTVVAYEPPCNAMDDYYRMSIYAMPTATTTLTNTDNGLEADMELLQTALAVGRKVVAVQGATTTRAECRRPDPVPACDFTEVFDVAVPTCEHYCREADEKCGEVSPLYKSTSECKTACMAMNNNGYFGATSGSSLQCRLYHLSVITDNASKKIHCPHAGADGGGVCFGAFKEAFVSLSLNVVKYKNVRLDQARNLIKNALQLNDYKVGLSVTVSSGRVTKDNFVYEITFTNNTGVGAAPVKALAREVADEFMKNRKKPFLAELDDSGLGDSTLESPALSGIFTKAEMLQEFLSQEAVGGISTGSAIFVPIGCAFYGLVIFFLKKVASPKIIAKGKSPETVAKGLAGWSFVLFVLQCVSLGGTWLSDVSGTVFGLWNVCLPEQECVSISDSVFSSAADGWATAFAVLELLLLLAVIPLCIAIGIGKVDMARGNIVFFLYLALAVMGSLTLFLFAGFRLEVISPVGEESGYLTDLSYDVGFDICGCMWLLFGVTAIVTPAIYEADEKPKGTNNV